MKLINSIIPALFAISLLSPSLTAQQLTEKREKPDYGNQNTEESSFVKTARITGRVIFFPLFLVTEYGVRYPIGFIASSTERYKVPEKLKYYTTWYDDRIGIRPIFTIQNGLSPSAGALLFFENLLAKDSRFEIQADSNFIRNFTFRSDFTIHSAAKTFSYSIGGEIADRDDFVFFGQGNDFSGINRSAPTVAIEEEFGESRFFRQKIRGYLGAEWNQTAGFGGMLETELSRHTFRCAKRNAQDICGADHQPNNSDDLYALDTENSASFFTSGYKIVRIKSLLYYDSREERPKSGSGIRIETFGRLGHGIEEFSEQVKFGRYGGELGLFWDVIPGRQRIIGLRAYAELAENIGSGTIPFGELITMGGNELMRGHTVARFHGRSSLVFTLDYRYPIWSFLDGYVYADLGNVFESRFDDLAFEKMRATTGFGVRTNSSRYSAFHFLFSLTSNRFDSDKLAVEFADFSFGASQGF